MNVEELLEMMEETLEAGTIVPFSASKRMVDVDRMRDIIDEVPKAASLWTAPPRHSPL